MRKSIRFRLFGTGLFFLSGSLPVKAEARSELDRRARHSVWCEVDPNLTTRNGIEVSLK